MSSKKVRPAPAMNHRSKGAKTAANAAHKNVCFFWFSIQAVNRSYVRAMVFQHAFFRRRGRAVFFRPFSAAFNTFTTAGALRFVAFFRIQRGTAEAAGNTAREARLYSQIKACAFFGA